MRMSRIAVAASALMSAVAIVSCVNADYDLSKPIDMTVAVDGDISMPLIKNSEFITVGELLKDTDLGENIELVPFVAGEDPENPDTRCYYMLKVQGNPDNPISGNFGKLDFDIAESFQNFNPEPFTASTSLNGLTIDLSKAIDAEETVIAEIVQNLGLNSPIISIVGKTPSEINGIISKLGELSTTYPEIDIDAIEYPTVDVQVEGKDAMPIEIKAELPKIIKGLGLVEMNMDLTFKLGPDFGKIALQKGFRIDFPDKIQLRKTDTNEAWSLKDIEGNKNVIEFGETFTVTEGTELKLEITGIDGAGSIDETNAINIKDNFSVFGTAVCSAEEILNDQSIANTQIPEDIKFKAIIDLGKDNIRLGEAQVELDLDAALGEGGIEKQEIPLGEILPEEIAKNEITLDLHNPVILLNIANDSPLAASLKATIDAFDSKGASVLDNPIDLSDKVNIKENTTKDNPQKIAISRQGYSDNGILPENDIVIEELGDLISKLPEKIVIDGIGIDPEKDGDGYTTIALGTLEKGKVLAFSCDYEVRAPLAFGEKLDIRYALERITGLNKNFSSVNGTGEDMKINLNKLQLDFTVANSLPIALGLEVTPIDLDGNPIEDKDLKVEINFTNAAGKPEILSGKGNGEDTEPQETTISVLIEPASLEVLEKLDGLDVFITGNSGDAAGVALNNKQGLQITDATVNIIGGVEMDLGNM